MTETPIYSSLINYVSENNIRLHMPGHIGKVENLVEELQSVAALDITEVPGIDDLHLPDGAIKKGLHLLAKAYGANESLFLVNGASSGVQAIFLALATAGQRILIPRNSHRSFYTGFVLSGLWPEYLSGEIEPTTGLTVSVDPYEVEQALNQFPDITGVFLTSPSYYGTTVEVKEIVESCRQKKVPLFVDEAHGSHFPFHPDYPTPALKAGADAVVNGLHKSLPVFNQGASLHMADTCKLTEEIKRAVSLVTTTSPSFPILASIDLARALMEREGSSLLDQALNLSSKYKNKINTIKGLKCLTGEFKDIKGVSEVDPLKILVVIDKLSINGFELADILRYHHNIQVELAEQAAILAMFSIFHTEADWAGFYQALEKVAIRYYTGRARSYSKYVLPLPPVVLSPRQAYFSRKRTIKLQESLGLIAGEMVAAYPPGIPALLAGELITREVLEYLLYLRTSDVSFQGPRDKALINIDIIEQPEVERLT
ncbi:MAG TPA: aminotransferase class I/II-fold pyridoxal phosphate-dependent enzyme [Syntrophomonadaceae bacterium]|nr:aminotransferase class I/II-fold pyridoxal phosphate-dependent enzyme [Syntrophomonadaceae bacterium]